MIDMKLKWCIPSKGRSDYIKGKTLALLEKHSINKKDIYIFVEKDELSIYKDALSEYQIVEGAKGISKQRETISEYFPRNEFIVSIDDDVSEIYEHGNPVTNLLYICHDIFNHLIANNMTLAGCNPCQNTFFAKKTITTDLKFCCGAFKCFINKPELERRDYELVEDYENTLKHYCYSGGILRFNYITLKVNYNSAKGGLKGIRTLDKKLYEVKKFTEQYSNYCKAKKEGMEVALYKNPKREIIKSLWIGLYLNQLSELALMSWLRLDYEIHLYVEKLNLPKYMEKYMDLGQLKILDCNTILEYNGGEICPYSDIFRYKLLLKGATWCDMDLVLIRRLPNDSIIISSEHTFQSGAFKSAKTYTPNIGVLRFPPAHPCIESTIKKIENKLSTSTGTDNMVIFKKFVNKFLGEHVSPAEHYCPVPFWQTKELYYSDNYLIKYGVNTPNNKHILDNCYGVHMWNNITYNKHNIIFNKSHINSLYSMIYNIVYN